MVSDRRLLLITYIYESMNYQFRIIYILFIKSIQQHLRNQFYKFIKFIILSLKKLIKVING